MRKLTLLLIAAAMLLAALPVSAEEVWVGPPLTFTRPPNVDGYNQANWDIIVEGVVGITRMTGGGSIWNGYTDPLDTFTPCSGPYPGDTEWAVGDISDYATLSYCPFLAGCYAACFPFYFFNPSPPSVLHIISQDIYIPIQFNYWECCGTGGFEYVRGTPPITPTEDSTFSTIKAMY